MTLFTDLAPDARSPVIDWRAIEAAFDWFRELAGCQQDPVFHAEGDVAIHTRMVVEALVADPDWRALTEAERATLFWAALLHDVAKPATTRIGDDGRITARGHSRRGQIMARIILWRLSVPFRQREQICHLITHHQVPYYLLERDKPERLLHLISHQTRCNLLAILATADVRGRICQDASRLHDNIALFSELAREQECLTAPRAFANDHSRFLYFRLAERSPDYTAHDDWWSGVTLLSGLPASGKDTGLAAHRGDHAVVSLDDLRADLGVDPADQQGPVLAAAREQAKVALRAGRPLIWNGTNLSRDRRDGLISLFADYRAKVTIVYCETSEPELSRRNAARDSPVPAKAVTRMLDHWQPPDQTECHALEVVR